MRPVTILRADGPTMLRIIGACSDTELLGVYAQ